MKRNKKSRKKDRVYMDYASATPVDSRVVRIMRALEPKLIGNPGALHEEGREAKKILEEARKSASALLRAHPDEIVFTSGATEANNLAITGIYEKLLPAFKRKGKAPHIITSTIEHKSVLEPIKRLGRLGAKITYLKPDKDGIISPKKLFDAIKPETVLVSIMYANNEIGTIEPVRDIAREVRRARKTKKMLISGAPFFHTDAAQAFNYCDVDMQKLGVDLLTISSPKIYGPSGIGALFLRRGVAISPQILGGGQERGIRSGREQPLLAAGFAEAMNIVEKERMRETLRLSKLRDYFFKKIFEILPKAKANGSLMARLPNNVNICIPDLDAELAVYALDARGIACSSASTCMNANEDSYSYVAEQIAGGDCAASSLRFSLGRGTTKKDVDDCLKSLKDVSLMQRKLWIRLRSNR